MNNVTKYIASNMSNINFVNKADSTIVNWQSLKFMYCMIMVKLHESIKLNKERNECNCVIKIKFSSITIV